MWSEATTCDGGGGTVIEGGAAVLIHLTVECARGGFEAIEAHASASQGAASGMGGFGLKCSGKARSYDVRVASFGELRGGDRRGRVVASS